MKIPNSTSSEPSASRDPGQISSFRTPRNHRIPRISPNFPEFLRISPNSSEFRGSGGPRLGDLALGSRNLPGPDLRPSTRCGNPRGPSEIWPPVPRTPGPRIRTPKSHFFPLFARFFPSQGHPWCVLDIWPEGHALGVPRGERADKQARRRRLSLCPGHRQVARE